MNVTKAIWDDVIDEIPNMWMNEVYPGYESEHWSIPARPVNPTPWRHSHPALIRRGGDGPAGGVGRRSCPA